MRSKLPPDTGDGETCTHTWRFFARNPPPCLQKGCTVAPHLLLPVHTHPSLAVALYTRHPLAARSTSPPTTGLSNLSQTSTDPMPRQLSRLGFRSEIMAISERAVPSPVASHTRTNPVPPPHHHHTTPRNIPPHPTLSFPSLPYPTCCSSKLVPPKNISQAGTRPVRPSSRP